MEVSPARRREPLTLERREAGRRVSRLGPGPQRDQLLQTSATWGQVRIETSELVRKGPGFANHRERSS
jgi:hypothetical protein